MRDLNGNKYALKRSLVLSQSQYRTIFAIYLDIRWYARPTVLC